MLRAEQGAALRVGCFLSQLKVAPPLDRWPKWIQGARDGAVPVHLEIWDDDSGLRGDDEQCDISATPDRHLQFGYSLSAGTLHGVAAGPAAPGGAGVTVHTQGDSPDARAEIWLTVQRVPLPLPVPPQQVTVTFHSVKLTDPSRPGQSAAARFEFQVGTQPLLRYPSTGTIQVPLGAAQPLPAGLSTSPGGYRAEPSYLGSRHRRIQEDEPACP